MSVTAPRDGGESAVTRTACALRSDSDHAFGYPGIDPDRCAGAIIDVANEHDSRNGENRIGRLGRHSTCHRANAATFATEMIVGGRLSRIVRRRLVAHTMAVMLALDRGLGMMVVGVMRGSGIGRGLLRR